MKKKLSEKKALKKLDISSFSAMTEDKLPIFADLLPQLDPDVAKKALEQFPNFSKLSAQMISIYKELLDRGFDENKNSVNAYYDACNRILDSLQKELTRKFITPRKRDKIIQQMIEVADMINRKDAENKQFIVKQGIGAGAFIFAVLGVIASVLTFGKINLKK